MKNIIKKSLQALLIVPVLALGVSLVAGVVDSPVALAQCTNDVSGGIAGGAGCAQGEDQQSDLFGESGIFKTITNVLLFIIGAISVIMLIIGGIRYTTSNGDSGAVTTAKNTILYAVIGIIVALLAYALVNFVITSFVEA
jgi:type IV secretion system pilin